MKASAAISAKEASAKQESSRSRAQPAQAPQPVFSPPLIVQRKCACGGGCPSCQEEQLEESRPIQTKLRVNTPGDAFEREADRIADQVVGMSPPLHGVTAPLPVTSVAAPLAQRKSTEPSSSPVFYAAQKSRGRAPPSFSNNIDPSQGSSCLPLLQRKCACGGSVPCSDCEDEPEKMAQRKSASGPEGRYRAGSDVLPQNLGFGRPLDDGIRLFMESRFGSDFSQVRVHDNAKAALAAHSVNALAYTVGRDIVFGEGRYVPSTLDGKKLLAHELTHVLQQDTSTLRRKDEESEGERTEQKIDDLDAPDFGGSSDEPACPKGGVQLGRIEPDPPCAVDLTPENDDKWLPFEFCRGSDVFRDGGLAADRLRSFARNQQSLTQFIVHAYASIEGNDQQNANLSCYRARRVERELLNAGVLPENIEVKGKGKTSKFDVKPHNHLLDENLRANRRVVVKADTSNIPPTPELPPPEPLPPEPTPQDRLKQEAQRRRQTLDTASAILTGGHYRVAADAYMSRWTCGEFQTLREAVARTEVRTVGEQAIGERKAKKIGAATETDEDPMDIIILSPQTFSTVEPLNCVMARIIDLTFHLKVKPHLADFNKRHAGGLFLAELAGIPPCADADPTSPGGLNFWFGIRPNSDPLENEPLPPCADKPLEGAFVSEKEAKEKGHDLGGKKPLEFVVAEPLTVIPVSEPVNFSFDLTNNRASLETIGEPAMAATAVVEARGDPSLFPRYQLGFIRTIQHDVTDVEYVDGFRLRRSLPTPVRDGSPTDPAPWLRAPLQPGPPDAPVKLKNTSPPTPPQLDFPLAILTAPFLTFAPRPNPAGALPAVGLPGRLPIDPLAENILRSVERRVEYTLWTAARRVDLPVDRLNIRFLEAQEVTVREKVDMRISSTGQLDPKGTTKMTAQDAGPGLEVFARLDGPVPDAFGDKGAGFMLGDKRVVSRALPEDRDASDDGEDNKFYRQRVIDTTTPIRQQLGLSQPLTMRIEIDRDSGHMLIPGIESRKKIGLEATPPIMTIPVQVEVAQKDSQTAGVFAPRSTLDALAELFYMRRRGDLVLRRQPTTIPSRKEGSSFIEIDLPALPGAPKTLPHLHQIPGALKFFREAWSEFSKHCSLEQRISVIIDRRTGLLRGVPEIGKPARIENGQIIHSVPLCLDPEKLGENHLNVHESLLGAIHTHPEGIPPDDPDSAQVAQLEGLKSPLDDLILKDRLDMQRQCGTELYTMLRNQNGDVTVVHLGPDVSKNQDLGPILGNIPGCKL
jgi:outer membrane protein OmpA-like peptidoglycan-associated protein